MDNPRRLRSDREPPGVSIRVIFTGNHFVLDPVAGLLVVAAARWAAGVITPAEMS